MILQPTSSVVHFCRSIAAAVLLGERISRLLPSILTTFVLSKAKRTQTELARSVLSMACHKSTMSRIFRDRRFRSRDLYRQALAWAVARLLAMYPEHDSFVWLVAIDGTSTSRGAFTKIAGANQFREKKTHAKGRSTKAHTFLMGILITHEGVRAALPRYTCFPKDHRGPGRPRQHRLTQQDLMCLMLRDLAKLLPKRIKLVVTADEYFEGKKLFALARRLGFVAIVPVDSKRCFADDRTPSKSNGRRIHDRGLGLALETFERVDLRRGSEKTVSYRRYDARKPGPKDHRTYWVRHERRTVTGLGLVGVIYSRKSPVYEPQRNFEGKTFKVLVCSDPSWMGATVVEWFEMRWTAIEIFFREIKQELGLAHYVGQDLQAFERHVDMVLLSFLYLEMNRLDVLKTTCSTTERAGAKHARTQGMQALVRREASRDLWRLINKAGSSERARRRLKRYCAQQGGATDA